jgi:hypothetical protein
VNHHLERGPRRERLMRRTLPYGVWTCESGREVLFNRGYRPIWQRSGEVSQPADYNEWVADIVKQEWFFHDSNPPWRSAATLRICLSVLKDFQASWEAIEYYAEVQAELAP